MWAIVVAAGSGARFGGPKQYEVLAGRRVLDWSLAAARAVCDGVVLVVAPERASQPEPAADTVVAGGATRSASVRAGLGAVPADAAVVVVHDAARPAASAALFVRVVDAVLDGADAAVPGVAVADTMKHVDPAGTVVATPDRGALVAVQTPQAFRAAVLRAAHAGGGDATDDAALVEAAGGRVRVVDGDPVNRKLTTRDDAEALLRALGDPRAGVPALRVGTGYDVHPFSDDRTRPLVLAGVVLAGHRGLAGHSDADAVAHAVTDALLGAAGLGDIGQHFPDTDPRWKGADSMRLLEATVALLRERGWMPVNVDCTVVLEAPRLAPHREEMRARLAAVLGADASVKAKRAEGLGALGRREGVACHAVALVVRSW